jgi:SOS-response transcriptional repressor LexA
MGAQETTTRGHVRVFEALGEPCGVVLFVEETGECAMRFRRDWDQFAGDEAELLAGLANQLETDLSEMGPTGFLQWVDSSLSNSFRVSEPKTALVGQVDRTLNLLYRKFVPSEVQQFRTHLPLMSIRAAAGGFGSDMANRAETWVDVDPPGRKSLSDDLFLVRIEGRSMEPDIPDGSVCLFRLYQGGSRKGGIYLVQRIGTLDEGGELTIKRYDSRKRVTEEGWSHEGIEMQPDNPEFNRWQLSEEDRHITVAEFLTVIEDPDLD